MGRTETRGTENGGKTTGAKATEVSETGGKEKGAKAMERRRWEGSRRMGRRCDRGRREGKRKEGKCHNSQETGGKGDRLMGERETDNSLPDDTTAKGKATKGIPRKIYSEVVIEGVRRRAKVFVGNR